MKPFALHDIDPRGSGENQLAVVVDTPRGSANKFKYDEKLGLFKLSRILPRGMSFPCDFGSVPQTRAADGDALDILILTEAPTFVGCLITVRLLGVLRATQKEDGHSIRNDRLISIALAVDLPLVLALIDSRREELRAKAVSRGRQLYEEKPRAFVSRLHGYWSNWQAGS